MYIFSGPKILRYPRTPIHTVPYQKVMNSEHCRCLPLPLLKAKAKDRNTRTEQILRNKDIEHDFWFSVCSSAAAAYLRHSVMRARLPRLQAVCSGVSPNLFLAFTLILARGLAAVEQEEDGGWFVPLAERPPPEDFRWSSLALSQLLAEEGGVPAFDPWSETSTSTLTKFTIRSLTKIKKQRWSKVDVQLRL
jgi:hypothetical protein